MEGADLVLVVLEPGAPSVRARLAGVLTTVGSAADADVRLMSAPPRWIMVQRTQDLSVLVRILATGASHGLRPGDRVVVDGLALGLELAADPAAEALPVADLAEALAGAEAPADALALLVRGLIRATSADGGAVILKEGDGYTVPVAESASGGPLDGAAALLSDTLVRDVLESGERVGLVDVPASERYGRVPSVLSLRLRSVLCVPMKLGGKVLGAIFLGKKGLHAPFSERHAADLGVLATMAVPLLVQLRRADAAASRGPREDLIVGDSPTMIEVRRLLARVAPSDLTVLVLGPTGSGKDVVARAVHAASPRADRTLVALNCAAVPEGLLASELFGVVKGAYTGALTDRKGRFEQADGSTLFLDEVGDMPLAMQAALLRVLEERAVTRLGDGAPRPVDYRLVAATHRDLDAEVAAGRFREDLLYRLREVTVTLPRLADRGGDVLLLAHLFLKQVDEALGLGSHRFGSASLEALEGHDWPGNVRELRSAVRRAAILADGPVIEPAHLQLREGPRGAAHPRSDELPKDLDRPLAEARDEFVAQYVQAVVARHDGNREAAAAALGISLRSLYRYLSATSPSGGRSREE